MISLDVRHSFGKFEARLADYQQHLIPAAVRSMNRSATTGRNEGGRMLQEEYPGLKLKKIKGRIKFKKAKRSDPVAQLTFSGSRISLYDNFGMRRQRGRKGQWGVTFRKLPWRVETIGGEEVTGAMLARAFRQRSASGVSVFSRLTKERLSATILVAPGIARAIDERGYGEKIATIMRARFAVEFARELNYRIRRK